LLLWYRKLGPDTWSFTSRKEHTLNVFENRVLRKQHIEELNNLCSSENITRVNKLRMVRWVGHVARHGGDEKCMQNFSWKILRKDIAREI
jgi:hypothetical protein